MSGRSRPSNFSNQSDGDKCAISSVIITPNPTSNDVTLPDQPNKKPSLGLRVPTTYLLNSKRDSPIADCGTYSAGINPSSIGSPTIVPDSINVISKLDAVHLQQPTPTANVPTAKKGKIDFKLPNALYTSFFNDSFGYTVGLPVSACILLTIIGNKWIWKLVERCLWIGYMVVVVLWLCTLFLGVKCDGMPSLGKHITRHRDRGESTLEQGGRVTWPGDYFVDRPITSSNFNTTYDSTQASNTSTQKSAITNDHQAIVNIDGQNHHSTHGNYHRRTSNNPVAVTNRDTNQYPHKSTITHQHQDQHTTKIFGQFQEHQVITQPPNTVRHNFRNNPPSARPTKHVPHQSQILRRTDIQGNAHSLNHSTPQLSKVNRTKPQCHEQNQTTTTFVRESHEQFTDSQRESILRWRRGVISGVIEEDRNK